MEYYHDSQNLILWAIIKRMEKIYTKHRRAKDFLLERLMRPINELKNQRLRAE